MKFRRLHRKVLVWWGAWWGAQLVLMPEFSLGIRIEPRRPLVDLFIGPLTLAFGKHPVLTDPRTKQRHSCRGFVIEADAYEAMVF